MSGKLARVIAVSIIVFSLGCGGEENDPINGNPGGDVGADAGDGSNSSADGGSIPDTAFDDAGEEPDGGGGTSWEIPVELPSGEPVAGTPPGGPMYGEDGCIIWDPATAPRTETSGGTMYDEEGTSMEFEDGAEVAPLGLCATHIAEVETIEEFQGPLPPPPAHPTCTPDDQSGCPPPATEPTHPPAHRPDAPEPVSPTPYTEPTPPTVRCSDGFGFSFEDGTIAGWTGHQNAPKEPVFGNNVSIKRLRPPGFYPVGTTAWDDYVIEREIGGDYWEFSRDVNQQGNWWYGTGDQRPSHSVRPGTTLPERQVGYLVSQEFEIDATYLSFLIGGSSDVAQRVELQVLAADDNDLGLLYDTYQGIGTSEHPEGGFPELQPDPNNEYWLVVRAASSLEDTEYMGRRVVWNVDEYAGRKARLRIVDEERDPWFYCDPTVIVACVQLPKMAHINVDDFTCHDTAPDDMVILPSGMPNDYVGHVLKPQPIWGFTESHSHATANLSFGGHMIWGDMGDELFDVYNCLHDLPKIEDKSFQTLRPAITGPRRQTTCFMKAEIVAAINSSIHGICLAASAVIAAIPFVGPLLAAAEIAACTALVNVASAALLTTPLVTGHYYHGAEMPTSGAIELGPMFTLVQDLLVELEVLESREIDRIPGMIEEKDFDLPDGTHSGLGLGQFHNHYQKDMIRRAHEGGLRLMVIDVHNSRAMQGVLDGKSDYDDWRATEDHVRAVRRLVAGPSDPEWPQGALHDIAAIAYTPQQARDIINGGRMAIILGVEVMELGKMRDPSDSIDKQVTDLYAMGIRKITAIHGTNNPLGGSALFQDVYQSANIFNNLTVDENGEDVAEYDDLIPPIDLSLPGDFPFPFDGMSLGTWGLYRTMVAPDCVGPCDWNLANQGHFELTNDPDPDDVIGEVERVNWRLGFPSISPMQKFDDPTDVDSKYLHVNQTYSLAWLLGEAPVGGYPFGCAFEGMYVPLPDAPPDEIEMVYDSHAGHGHFNARGITPEGEQFLEEMMKRGILLDTDHFSQAGRAKTFELTEEFAQAAGWGPDYDYAVFGVHTELRGREFGGPFPDFGTFAAEGGTESEISKTKDELERMTASKGTITISVPGYMHDAPYGDGVVANDCDYSSKGYAHKYLNAMELMNGRGLTPGFDMNGFAPFIASRYGVGNACRSGITMKGIETGGYTPDQVATEADWQKNPPLANWPRDWAMEAEAAERCRYNGSLKGEFWDKDCESTKMIQAQQQEFSAILYDDYIGKPRGSAPWLASLPPGHEVILARSTTELRDDGAPRAPIDEWVYVGGGGEFAQVRPMVKWRNNSGAVGTINNTGWDYNLDGMRHIGLMPDLMQDLRNVGVTWELLTPMFNSVEHYIQMWEQNCEMASDWLAATGGDTSIACAPHSP